MRLPILIAALLAGAASPALAQQNAPFTVVESGKSFYRLDDAVKAIGEGDGTIRIAPGRYKDCAIQTGGRVAFVAQASGTAIFDGGICEDKATLVLRGKAAHVDGLVFTHTSVPDGNGAGIRIEQGDLSVANTRFVDGQCGILSANDLKSKIVIDKSTFSGLGKHPNGNGAHSLYIGDYGSLTVTNTRFERGTGGHYLKSRSPRVQILNNSFDDSQGRDTNYMIDLPGGATGRIAGNTFVDGLNKENHSARIAVAAENRDHPSAGLVIENNRASLVPGFPWSTFFVGDWSHEPLAIRNNTLVKGIGTLDVR
jgi:hypothetical protein